MNGIIPYGYWVCPSRIVLFDRRYRPRWEISASDNKVRRADPDEWIRDAVEQEWFYNDATPPSDMKELEKLAAKLNREMADA